MKLIPVRNISNNRNIHMSNVTKIQQRHLTIMLHSGIVQQQNIKYSVAKGNNTKGGN